MIPALVSMLGTVVGNYRLTAKIAEGGMGTVYRAEHTTQGRPAAIKLLHPELSHNRSIVDRFFNEAKATTSIRHPGIVDVFDFGYLPSGNAYLVMEFLEGEPLSRYLKRRGGRIPEAEAAWLIRGLCSPLAAAHGKNIVHRDLKPDNVFMVPDPSDPLGVRAKVLDFGIAKLSGSEIASSKTRTGSVLGTPTYMSPEQCKGTGDVDHRADLYSLGCMLYELLCGRPPFVSEGAGELIGAHLFVAPDSPRVYAPSVSAGMEALVVSLLAKNRDQRPSSATALGEQLGTIARASGGWAAMTAPVPRPSRPQMADAATMMDPLGMPGSGPVRTPARDSNPSFAGTPMPMPAGMRHTPMPTPPPPAPGMYGAAPHGMYTPPPLMNPTPPPMLTPPPPPSITTLSGAAGMRTGEQQPPGRARWVVALVVIVLFAGASAATTYLVMGKKETKKAAGGGGGEIKVIPTPPDPTPAPTPDPAPQRVDPPAPPLTPTPTPTPPTPPVADKKADDKKAADKKAADDDKKADEAKDDEEKKERRKKRDRKKTDGNPVGPIETDI
jgi:serine/threonine-protein kinase